jgi:hypothetical protein
MYSADLMLAVAEADRQARPQSTRFKADYT